MKIRALILSFVFVTVSLLSVGTVSAANINVVDSEQDVLISLGVINDNLSENMTITRGQFVSYVMKALNYDIEPSIDGSFIDVDNMHSFAEDIYKAKLMGVISGAGGNRFNPDEPITYNSAVKIMVSALGYMKIAEYHGGYPVGYSIVAADIGLVKRVHISGEDALKKSDALKLLYNFLNCDMCMVTNVNSDQVGQQRQYGKSIITENYNMKTVTGVVKSGGFNSSIPDFHTEIPVLEIGGKIYKTQLANSEQYIGFNVDAYVDCESEQVKAVYIKNNNSYVEIEGKDIIAFTSYTIEVIAGDGTAVTEYALDKGFYYVKNGRASFTEPIFMGKNNKVKIIDNNSDGIYDFAIEERPEYMVVTAVSSIDGDVVDVIGNKKVHFGDSMGYHYNVLLDGALVNYTDIPVGSVLTYMVSDDGYIVNATVSKETVKGKITEIGDNYVLIDGKEYILNEYFTENCKINPGVDGEFLISDDGSITSYRNSSSNELRYAYLIDAFETQSGLSGEVAIRILDQSGQKFSYSFADKIRFDGTILKNNDSRILSAIFNGNYPKYQVLKYGLNEDGKINRLDTFTDVDNTLTAELKFCSDKDVNNSLTRFVHNAEAYHSYNYRSFLPFTTLGDKSVVFSIPTDLADINNTDGEDKRLRKYIDDDFNVVDTKTFDGTQKYIIDVYDQDEFLQPGIVVVYRGSAGGFSINTRMTPQLVSRVVDAIDNDGTLTKKVTVLSGANFVSYYINPEKLSYLQSNGKVPKSGDIIKYATDSTGMICDISICITYNQRLKTPQVVSQASDQVYYPVHIGKPFNHNTSTLALKILEGPTYTSYYSAAPVNNIGSFTIPSNLHYYRYDATCDIAKCIESSDIKDIAAVGEKEASVIATHSAYHNITIVVEYICEK